MIRPGGGMCVRCLRAAGRVGHPVVVFESKAPAMVHDQLGALYAHGVGELRGSIDVPRTIRAPRMNGQRDLEILIRVPPGLGESLVRAHVDQCARRIRRALEVLPRIKESAIEYAPREWVEHYSSLPGERLPDRLFLDGLEVDGEGIVTALFDFGDLDLLAVQLDDDGRSVSAAIVP